MDSLGGLPSESFSRLNDKSQDRSLTSERRSTRSRERDFCVEKIVNDFLDLMGNLGQLTEYQALGLPEFLERFVKKTSSWFLVNGSYFPKKLIHSNVFFEQMENEIQLVILKPVLL